MPEYTGELRHTFQLDHPPLDTETQLVAFKIGPVNQAITPFMPNRNMFNALQGVKKRVIHKFYKNEYIYPTTRRGRPRPRASWKDKDSYLETIPEDDAYKRLHHFVQSDILTKLQPFDTIEISRENLEKWLAVYDRPEARKNQIRQAYDHAEERGFVLSNKDCRCKTFLKKEFYEDRKYPRCINPREDMVVAILGYAIHKLEEYIFHESEFKGYFIKGQTPEEQIETMAEKFQRTDSPKLESDYTSFEGSMTPMYQHITEVAIFRHMFKNSPRILKIIEDLYRQTQLRSKLFNIVTIGSRMSGDLWTSLGNGLCNLINVKFLMKEHGIIGDGLVEGDDGLWWFDRPALKPEHFLELGFKIKMDYQYQISDCAFCQKIFNPETHNLLAPPELINRIGWCNNVFYIKQKPRILRGLLAAKALSYLTLYPRCPMISIMMTKILHYLSSNTTQKDINEAVSRSSSEDWYHKWLLSLNTSKLTRLGSLEVPEIDYRDRILFEHRFGVSVELQIIFEYTFDPSVDFFFQFDMPNYEEGPHQTVC